MLPDGRRVPAAMAASPFDHQGAPRRPQAPPVLERHAGLKDPRRPASLVHAYIVVSLMAGVRPEEARAIGWEEDVDLDGNPPSVAVLRADRAGGDTKTPRSRRALRLAQMAVGALREWQVDQAAEREAAGSHWQDTGRVFTTATGTPLSARPIRKMFQDVCEGPGSAGTGRLGICGTRPSRCYPTMAWRSRRSRGLLATPAAMSPRPSLLGVAAVIIACRANRRDLPAIVRAWRMGPHDDDPENPPRDDDGDDDSGKNPPSLPEP